MSTIPDTFTTSEATLDASKRGLEKLLQEFSSLFFITMTPAGGATLRPMHVADASEPGVLWFATTRDSEKARQADHENVVYLTGQSGSTFVAARGTPEIFTDAGTRQRLWKAPFQIWFPQGINDPELCFIKVTIQDGEYWNTSGLQKISYALKSLTALATGTKPIIADPAQHGKVP